MVKVAALSRVLSLWGLLEMSQGYDRRILLSDQEATASNLTALPIVYQGGEIMNNGIKLYYIWYGAWKKTSAAVPIVEDFARGLGESQWWKVTTLYNDAK